MAAAENRRWKKYIQEARGPIEKLGSAQNAYYSGTGINRAQLPSRAGHRKTHDEKLQTGCGGGGRVHFAGLSGWHYGGAKSGGKRYERRGGRRRSGAAARHSRRVDDPGRSLHRSRAGETEVRRQSRPFIGRNFAGGGYDAQRHG